jgi:hypothetical protein
MRRRRVFLQRVCMTRRTNFLDGPYLRSAVHGATDGLITTATTIWASLGVNITVIVIVGMGIASVVGDATTLAMSDIVSTDTSRSKARLQYEAIWRRLREDRRAVVAAIAARMAAETPMSMISGDVLAVLPDVALARLAAFDEVDAAAPATMAVAGPSLAIQALVTVASFMAFGAVPIAALFLGDYVFPHGIIAGHVSGGFAVCTASTLALLAAFGALNGVHVGRSAAWGAATWLAALVPTIVAVYVVSASFDSVVPEALRSAQTCDMTRFFLRANEF